MLGPVGATSSLAHCFTTFMTHVAGVPHGVRGRGHLQTHLCTVLSIRKRLLIRPLCLQKLRPEQERCHQLQGLITWCCLLWCWTSQTLCGNAARLTCNDHSQMYYCLVSCPEGPLRNKRINKKSFCQKFQH